MRKSVVATVLIACCFIFSAGNVGAVTVAFGDTQNYWPGWNNGSDDGNDTIGTPNILGGKAEISENSYLTKLTFEVTPQAYLNLWDLVVPGDLFIDADADQTWDYYVDLVDSIGDDGKVTTGDGILCSIIQPLKDNNTDINYLMSKVPPRYGYRKDHPVGIEGGELVRDGQYFYGWPTVKPSTVDTKFSPYFTFGDKDILLESSFIVGWTQTCANDVVYEQIANPVPEPATMLLLGTGLIGLGWFGRRKVRG